MSLTTNQFSAELTRCLKMDNVVATPHLGYVERDNYELYYGIVVDQILAYAAGNPINVLNPSAVGKK
jgi:D-3-phosphoglycerate dehydrogenase / 2-oxoglutarate reductase